MQSFSLLPQRSTLQLSTGAGLRCASLGDRTLNEKNLNENLTPWTALAMIFQTPQSSITGGDQWSVFNNYAHSLIIVPRLASSLAFMIKRIFPTNIQKHREQTFHTKENTHTLLKDKQAASYSPRIQNNIATYYRHLSSPSFSSANHSHKHEFTYLAKQLARTLRINQYNSQHSNPRSTYHSTQTHWSEGFTQQLARVHSFLTSQHQNSDSSRKNVLIQFFDHAGLHLHKTKNTRSSFNQGYRLSNLTPAQKALTPPVRETKKPLREVFNRHLLRHVSFFSSYMTTAGAKPSKQGQHEIGQKNYRPSNDIEIRHKHVINVFDEKSHYRKPQQAPERQERAMTATALHYKPSTQSAAPPQPTPTATQTVTAPAPDIDVKKLSRDVMREIKKRQRVELERRGLL